MKQLISGLVCINLLLALILIAPATDIGSKQTTLVARAFPLYLTQVIDQNQTEPQLAGGPEIKQRKTHPVANTVLQRKYPQIFYMKGSATENRIALTWDDGPDQKFTPQVLDILQKYKVKGTFFLMGARAKALPTITRRIQTEGHAIGNHTYWHPQLTNGNREALYWQVKQTETTLFEILGYTPHLFRPPYGALNEDELQTLGKLHYTVIGWSVDSLDWKQLPADEVEQNILGNIHPGAIVLMHSGGNWNQDLSGGVQALERIIPKLKKLGYEFVTIPELLHVSC